MAPVWNLDPIMFYIPGLGWPVRYYGLIFSLVFIGGFFLFRWQILRAGREAMASPRPGKKKAKQQVTGSAPPRTGPGSEDEAFGFILPGALGVVLGARLGHVFFYNFDKFMSDPAWLFRIWEGGLASHGATLGLITALWYHSRHWKRPFWDTCDRFSFSAALGAAMVRLGNFLNSEIVGKVTDSRFGIRFPLYDGKPPELTLARYPSQLAEFGLGLMILAFLFWLDARLGREKRPVGALSAAFLILYFCGRFLVEFIKERHGQVDDFILSRGQLLSLPGVALGILLAIWVYQNQKRQTEVRRSNAPPNH